MAWLFGKRDKKVVITEGLWVKCDGCRETIYRADVERNNKACPRCGYLFRLSARERLNLLLDPNSFEERDAGLRSQDPLGFKDNRGRYLDRLRAAREKVGSEDALISGVGRIGGHPVVVAVFEFAFMGGSMASVVGEKVTRAIELAPGSASRCWSCPAPAGPAMQEGVLSLMQMAKTSAALAAARPRRACHTSRSWPIPPPAA